MNRIFEENVHKYIDGVLEIIMREFKGKKIGGDASKEMMMDFLFKYIPEVPPSPEVQSKPKKKKRKACETNWAELVITMKNLYPEIKTKQDLLNKIDMLKKDKRFVIDGGDSHLDQYVKDIKLRKEKGIENYIKNFDVDKFKGFEKVILSGKSIQNFNELKEVNINPKTNKEYERKWVKSDLYLIYPLGRIIGISVKDSDGATLTNYSVEKILKDINVNHDFKEDRISVLKECFGENYKYTKEQRPLANKLFYNKGKVYFTGLLENIEQNREGFKKEIFTHVFPSLHYEVYGYNGKTLKDLNELSNKIDGQKKEIRRNKNYETNISAKLWFSIFLDDIEEWKFCIRGKNDIYKGSFQILDFTKVH